MNRTGDFYLLMLGRLIAGAGSFFSLIALNLFVLVKTGSATMTGLAMATKLLAGCLASPYLGMLADKIDRKHGMVISDAALAIGMLVLALVPEGKNAIIAVFVVQAALGVFQNFFMINFQASLPLLAPQGNLLLANSWFQMVSCITIVVGALSAAAAVDLIGYQWAFACNGLCYLFSLGILLFLPITTQERSPTGDAAGQDDFMAGLRFLWRSAPFIFFLFFIRFLDGVGSGSHNVALPIFSDMADRLQPGRIYGLIIFAWGLGNLISVWWLNASRHGKKFLGERWFIQATLWMSVCWVLVFQANMLWWSLLFALLAGIFDNIAAIAYALVLQRTDDCVRGRVMALSTIAMTTGVGGGIALASVMADFVSPALLVALWHGIPVAFIVAFLSFRQASRRRS